jgi:hypothetical protein
MEDDVLIQAARARVEALASEGKLPADFPADVRQQLIEDYADRLENMIHGEIARRVDALGKLDEYERVLDSPLEPTEWLVRNIPNYHAWLRDVLRASAARL